MGNKALMILLLVYFILASSLCFAEKVALHFDARKWELGHNAKNNSQGIAEYVLTGESVENWSELVTAQIIFGIQTKTTPKEYMYGMKKGTEAICPELEWNVIRSGDKDIIFEWQVKDIPNYDDQYEITRIISGQEGIHIIHYATKKLPISNKKRMEWIKLLNSATLISN